MFSMEKMLSMLKFLSRWSWVELLVLALLPFPFVGMPDWGAPIIPDAGSGQFRLASFMLLAACVLWVVALVNATRKPKLFEEGIEGLEDFDFEDLNEHLSKALVELGEIALVFLSFKTRDARYALFGGLSSLALYLLLTRGAKDRGLQKSHEDQKE